MGKSKYKASLKSRLKLIVSGFFLLIFGLMAEWQGQLLWTNWFGQQIFAMGVAALGAAIVVLGLIPSSWLIKVSLVTRKRPSSLSHKPSIHPGKN